MSSLWPTTITRPRRALTLARSTAAMAPGTRVELGVLRRGEQKTIALQLAKLPDLAPQEPGLVGSPTSGRWSGRKE
jgi:hypothetical protein